MGAGAKCEEERVTHHFAELVSLLSTIKEGIMKGVGGPFRAIGAGCGEMVDTFA